MRTNLILDMSNLMYKAFHGVRATTPEIGISEMFLPTMQVLAKVKRVYNADRVVAAFDASSWRKLYTASDEALTYKKYKGNRRKDLAPEELRMLQLFDEFIVQFYEMVRDNSSWVVLRKKYLEADDLMAGFIKKNQEDKHIVVSSDKDMIQLLKYPNTFLVNAADLKERTLAEWDFDPDLFMFEKCIRGDAGDNVMSSYPRLRKNKLLEAYNDPYTLTNIMNHTFTVDYICSETGEAKSKEYKTKQVFKENRLLMDLDCQPEGIRELIDLTISKASESVGRFSKIQFLKFCDRNGLYDVIDNYDKFSSLFT